MTFPPPPQTAQELAASLAPTAGTGQRYNYFTEQAQRVTPAALPRGVRYSAQQIRGKPGFYTWEVEVYTVHGGINRTAGDLDVDYDRGSSSTLETRFYRTLALNQLMTNATTPDPATTLRGAHHVNAFGILLIGVGGDNDVSFFKETSATNPAIVAIAGAGTAGRPGDEIVSLSLGVYGGATSAERVIMGIQGAVPKVISDVAGTIDGTMHSNLTGLWGHIQTPLNNNTGLFYANGSLYSLNKANAITDAPTVVLSNVPQGGYALGLLRHGGGPLRAYWVWPKQTTTGGILTFGAEALGKVVSTNLEGTDPQDVDFGLKGIAQAVIVPSRSSIVAHDGERIVEHTGEQILDPQVFSDREPNSDREFRLRNMHVNDPDVYYEVNYRASPNGTGNTQRWIEHFNPESGAVHVVSAITELSSTGSFGVLSAGSAPFSKQNNYMHGYSDGSWRRMQASVPGHSTYAQRQSSGAQSNSGREYETTGTWKSTKWQLPGLHGCPILVKEIICVGDVHSAGTAATAGYVDVSAGGITERFFTGQDGRTQHTRRDDNRSAAYYLQVQIDAARTTGSTRFTPNCLPVIIRGIAYKPPMEMSDPEMEALLMEMATWTG